MCLLIVKPKGRHIERDWIINGAAANPHGNGAAWIEKDGLYFSKSVCSAESFANLAMDRIADRPAIIHFRFATHGKRDNDNCHPFPLLHGWWMAHNGIISGLDHPEMSDTALYAQLLKVRMSADPDYLEKPASIEQMEAEIGWSKLAFLNNEGRHIIINEEFGMWEDGVWFSNDGHKPPRPAFHWEGYGRRSCDWKTSFDRSRGWPDGEDFNEREPWSKEIGARDELDIYDNSGLYCDDCGVEFGHATGAHAHLSDDRDDLLCRDCYNWRDNNEWKTK